MTRIVPPYLYMYMNGLQSLLICVWSKWNIINNEKLSAMIARLVDHQMDTIQLKNVKCLHIVALMESLWIQTRFSEEKIFILNSYSLRLRRDETIIQSIIQSISMRCIKMNVLHKNATLRLVNRNNLFEAIWIRKDFWNARLRKYS